MNPVLLAGWPDFDRFVLILLIFIGGCIASSAGGLKILRLSVLANASVEELRRTLHSRMVLRVSALGRMVPLSMVGLEVGYDHRLKREDFARLATCAPRIGAFAGQLFFYPGTPEHSLSERGWPVFESLAAAVLIDPQCAQTAEWFVDVETKGALTYGETVIDEKGRLKQKPQTKVVLGYPHDRYLELLAQSLEALD